MSQILVQVKKALTLKDIAPYWAHFLKTGFKKHKSMMLRDRSCCIVGEAHGFTGNYDGCPGCHKYSMKIYENCLDKTCDCIEPEVWQKPDQSIIDSFVDHWNREHNK